MAKLDAELMTGKTALVGLGQIRGPCKPDRNCFDLAIRSNKA